ncbi:MAG: hypothetical protein R2828_08865 [Saprospiraceae bacterium]
MVSINANLDLKTNEVVETGRLNEKFADLCLEEETLGITLVARDRPFADKMWKYNGKIYWQVVLPYDEVLSTENIDLLIAQKLYEQADKLTWLDTESIKQKLELKMMEMA